MEPTQCRLCGDMIDPHEVHSCWLDVRCVCRNPEIREFGECVWCGGTVIGEHSPLMPDEDEDHEEWFAQLCRECGRRQDDHYRMCPFFNDMDENDYGWGPEDDGLCPCGGTSCDGTCDTNTDLRREEREYDIEIGLETPWHPFRWMLHLPVICEFRWGAYSEWEHPDDQIPF